MPFFVRFPASVRKGDTLSHKNSVYEESFMTEKDEANANEDGFGKDLAASLHSRSKSNISHVL